MAVDIRRGICFGEPERLCLRQRVREREPSRFHPVENVVARAIENAGDPIQPITGQSFLNGSNDRKASGHGGFVEQRPVLRPRQIQQLGSMLRDELLIGSDNGLAGAQGAANQIPRRLQTTDELDDDIHVGRERVIELLRPANV